MTKLGGNSLSFSLAALVQNISFIHQIPVSAYCVLGNVPETARYMLKWQTGLCPGACGLRQAARS